MGSDKAGKDRRSEAHGYSELPSALATCGKLALVLTALWMLIAPAVVFANPVAFGTSTTPEEIIGHTGEVLVTFFIVQSLGFRLIPFFVVWYVVNVLTLCLLLIGVAFSNSGNALIAVVIVGEVLVVLGEAAILVSVSQWSFVRRPPSLELSYRRALLATFAGNVVSLLAGFAVAYYSEGIGR
jgi:hypothetical protein